MRLQRTHCRYAWFAVVVSVITCERGHAAESKVSVSVTKEAVRIAEPFDVNFTVHAVTGSRVEFPVLDGRLGDLEVVQHHDLLDIPDEHNDAIRVWTRAIRVEILATGSIEVPAQSIHVIQGTSSEVIRTKPQRIEVLSVLEDRADPMKFRDLKDVIELTEVSQVSFSWQPWAYSGLAALVVAAMLASVMAIKRRRAQVTPLEWATGQLLQLRSAGDVPAGGAHVILSGLESTLRIFMESRFGFPATTKGRTELTASLQELVPLPDGCETVEQLERLLQAAEQAKYAGRSFEPIELNRLVDDAEQIVRQLEAGVPTLAEDGGAV